MNVNETVHRVLMNCGVKIETIIDKCERIDRNNDGIIHFNDFLKVLDKLCGVHAFNKQQMRYLTSFMLYDEHLMTVEYNKLYDLFSIHHENQNSNNRNRNNFNNNRSEVWTSDHNPQYSNQHQHQHQNRSRRIGKPLRNESVGSLGEFMEDCACPAEVR